MKGLLSRIFLLVLLLLLPGVFSPGQGEPCADGQDPCRALYQRMQLGGVIDYTAFEQAFEGLHRIGPRNGEILTLIDFTKPSTQERLYVLDLRREKLLFHSLVAHGQGSGANYATSFSNENGSHKSSLGFYLTGSTYQGGNGYSLLLEGLEKGINDRARERAIVIHGAPYVNASYAASCGRLGRSHGCPALPQALTRPIIDAIKGGTLLYIYAHDSRYLAQSTILPAVNAL